MNTIYDLLRSDGSVVINKSLMKAIGVDCAILYSELLSKHYYFSNRKELTDDGYFFNTLKNMGEDTCLSDYQQKKASNKLVKLGLIKATLRGVPAKRYFCIVQDESIILQFLKNSETRFQKTKELDSKKLGSNNTNGNKTNPTILNNDNGVSPDGKDSYCVNRDVVNAIKTYMIDYYVQKTKKKHAHLKPEQYKRVYESISTFAEENCLDYEGIVEIMICYLKNRSLDTDWNINHFATEGIMLNRLYESGVV